MIELVRDPKVINVLAKFENDPWKIMDVKVLTGLVCPAARPPARPLGVRQYPGALKGCGVKSHYNSVGWRKACKLEKHIGWIDRYKYEDSSLDIHGEYQKYIFLPVLQEVHIRFDCFLSWKITEIWELKMWLRTDASGINLYTYIYSYNEGILHTVLFNNYQK